jgi:hypothetical protein
MIILEHREYIYVVETYLYTLSYVKEKYQSVLILDIDDLNTGYMCIYIQGHHVAWLDLNILKTSKSRGVHCTKLVRIHVSAQEGY